MHREGHKKRRTATTDVSPGRRRAVPTPIISKLAGDHSRPDQSPEAKDDAYEEDMNHTSDSKDARNSSNGRDGTSSLSVPSTQLKKPVDLTTAALYEEIERLQAEVQRLQALGRPKEEEEEEAEDEEQSWRTLYRIDCYQAPGHRTFSDKPVLIQGDDHLHVDSYRRIPDEKTWEDAQSECPFVVYQTYACQSDNEEEDQEEEPPQTEPYMTREEVHILDEDLSDAIDELLQSHKGLLMYLSDGLYSDRKLVAPYIFYYHFADHITSHVAQAQDEALSDLMDYIREQSREEHQAVRALFATGRVQDEYMPYLFAPTELLLTRIDGDLVVVSPRQLISSVKWGAGTCGWQIKYTGIAFDGEFHFKSGAQALILQPDKEGYTEIRSLAVYPFRFEPETIRQRLLDRGREFWRCKEKRYVCSSELKLGGRDVVTEVRYMIDVEAYYILHSDEKLTDLPLTEPQPESNDFLLQLPASMQGYNMISKEWVVLRISDIKDIDWNIQAFNDLVIANKDGDDIKELIRALISNKIDADQGIDFVDGKGTGLVLLLHGSPGTGKTLTAESIAEITCKPLFRVTCGDVGTTPEKVEEYLDSVFWLGRRWGCVVLLDEADVFLEERALYQLERNALVSVFLRAIEYYDGILVLTSNRVGKFDEAFKSRIQLALPYLELTAMQRSQIWLNFIRKLEMVNERMNGAELHGNVMELARTPMNGRQIRNAINTARQLARYHDRPLELKDLKLAIRVSSRFDKYIAEVRNDVSDEKYAREKGDR